MNKEVVDFLVKPGSSQDSIVGLHGDYIKVKISSPPRKGEANKSFIQFIASQLKIPPSDIAIISGKKSSYKRLSIKYPCTTDIKKKLLEK